MVEVRLSAALALKWESDINVGNYLCKELAGKGVPLAAKGWLVPRPTRGHIVTRYDDVFDDFVWEWHE